MPRINNYEINIKIIGDTNFFNLMIYCMLANIFIIHNRIKTSILQIFPDDIIKPQSIETKNKCFSKFPQNQPPLVLEFYLHALLLKNKTASMMQAAKK